MNPFRSYVVANPWDSAESFDVSTIHHEVFQRCLQGIDQVRDTGHSAGLLIYGEAGSGKTHLLRRLRAHLSPRAPSATHRDECLYVWVRLQTSPRMIWRTVRRTLVEDWFRKIPNYQSQFQRILFHRLAEVRPAEGDLERWYDYMLDHDPAGLAEALDEIATGLELDRNTAVAFEHLAFGRHVRDLRAWLCGDSLPEAALDRLELTQDEGTDEEREDQSRQVVCMLCKLAGNRLPVVISFDQVEALQMVPNDRDALFTFGQLISTLHDATKNVLLVSCVQAAFFTELRDHARRADYDRMSSLGSWTLAPLSRSQVLEVIKTRLQQIPSDIPEGYPSTPGWPFSLAEIDALVAKGGGVTPRELLYLCAERFDGRPIEIPPQAVAGTGSEPPPDKTASIESFLAEEWERQCEEKVGINTPNQTDEIITHGLPLLVNLIAPEVKPVDDEILKDVSHIFETATGRTGLSLCTQSNMTSLAKQLMRLKTQLATNRLQRLLIVRDARIPLSTGAKKARQTLEELEQSAAVVLHPSVEVLAALDALRTLLSKAKSGDLECHGQSVSPQTVGDWLVKHLPDSLEELVEVVLGRNGNRTVPGSSETVHFEALLSLLSTHPVLPLDDVVTRLRLPIETLTAIVERHSEQFRILTGPPAMLFRVIEAGVPHQC